MIKNALPVHDYRCIKKNLRTYGDTFYTNIRDLNVSEDDIGCEYFTVIFYWFSTCIQKQILSASICKQLCLQNCKQTNDNLFW